MHQNIIRQNTFIPSKHAFSIISLVFSYKTRANCYSLSESINMERGLTYLSFNNVLVMSFVAKCVIAVD